MGALLGVVLRYAALLAARAIGWVRHLVLVGWRRSLAQLALAAGALWGLARSLDLLRIVDDSWLQPLILVAILGFLALARWVWTARSRLVVADFVDYRGSDPQVVPGLSSLLVVELARLHDLYRIVDESRAKPEAVSGPQSISFDEQHDLPAADRDGDEITNQPLDSPAPIRAEDINNVLDAATSVAATVTVGPLTLPIGAIAAIVGRLARGPQVTGAVHCVRGRLLLTARTVGDREARTWRVDGNTPQKGGGGDPPQQAEELLDELAVRMFTDLALDGSVRWRATAAHVDGLRAYRDCLLTKRDRRLRLEVAKERFVETIIEDDTFALGHYNLGVVATELGQFEAAEAAFLGSIERDNERWEPYYGLAQLYFVQERYDEMLPICDRVIRLRQRRAEAYHLRALALRRRGDVAAAMEARRAAVLWTWLRLCSAAWRGEETGATRLAATSLRNLAGMRAYRAKGQPPLARAIGYRAAQWELRQGQFLDASDAELRFELGKVYAARLRWRAAARQLRRAVEITPGRARFWIQLARAYAGDRGQCHEQADFAASRALEQPSQITNAGFLRLASIYERLGERHQVERVAELHRFELMRRDWRPLLPVDDQLERELQMFLDVKALWQTTQVCLQLAQRYLAPRQVEACARVAQCLATQLAELTIHYPGEVKRHDIHAVVAQALHAAGQDERALAHAEAAVTHNPLSCRARTALAEVHLSFRHFDQARDAWRAALMCDPDNPEAHLRLGECLVGSALDHRVRDRSHQILDEAARHLATALSLYELRTAADGDRHDPGSARLQKGRARFWLGRACWERDDYEQAVAHLRLSCDLGYEPLLARLRLAVAYLRMGALCEGERELRTLECRAEEAFRRNGQGAAMTAGPPGDELSLPAVLAWARLHLASSHIERVAEVDEAIRRIHEVKAQMEVLQADPEQTGILAACADWEGWARFKQNEPKQAIECLTRSIELQPTSEAYLHLALVHGHRAVASEPGIERQYEENRSREFAKLARWLGLGRQQAEALEEMTSRLERPSHARQTALVHQAN